MAVQRLSPTPLPSTSLPFVEPESPEKSVVGSFVEAPLYTWRYGQGEQIFVGLHGWNGDHHSFDTLLPWLPENATLYVVDLPGCGQSAPLQEWTLESVTEALIEQWDFMGWEGVTVLGNCSGALLGLPVAAELGEKRIQRMVMIDAFAYCPWYFALFVIPVFKWIFYYTAFANPIGRWLTNLSLKNKRKEDTSLTEGFQRCSPAVNLAYLKIFWKMPRHRHYKDLTMISDVVVGEKSFGDILKGGKLWMENWPSARFRSLRGAGHLPIQEAPEELAQVVFHPSPSDSLR